MSEQAFWEALAQQDHEAIRTCLQEQPDLVRASNAQSFGETPLNIATRNRDLDTIHLLLQHGANPNQGSDWKPGPFTPLESIPYETIDFAAPTRGPLAAALIEGGADLHINAAAHLNLLDRVTALLQQDPQLVTQRSGDGKQPLHWAATPEMAELLLRHNAPLEERDIDHESTPLDWAVQHRPAVGRYLIQQGAQASAFHAAAFDDLAALQQRLPEEPEGPRALLSPQRLAGPLGNEAMNILGFTVGVNCNLLHTASLHAGREVVTHLLAAGVDHAHRAGYDDATPLHLAAWHDNAAAATALLDGGADINVFSGEIHNNSPLGWAIVGGSANVVELLLQRGAEVLDFFADDARAGAEGAFSCWSYQPLESWQRIVKLLG